LSKDNGKTIQPEQVEKIWSLFFPEGTGILDNKEDRIDQLRAKRRIEIRSLNSSSLKPPLSKILFTSNALLTLPPEKMPPESFPFSDLLNNKLKEIIREEQQYWYDHPVQIGVEPEKNEILYGLRGLDEAIDIEKDRGNVPAEAKMTCLLSLSVTHKGLQQIARPYLTEALGQAGGLRNIDVLVFTEATAREIIDKVIGPASEHYLSTSDRKVLYDIFGVDGEYGRMLSPRNFLAFRFAVGAGPIIELSRRLIQPRILFSQLCILSPYGNLSQF